MSYKKKFVMMGCLIGIFLIVSIGLALSEEKIVVVNLMIDADINAASTPDQIKMAEDSLISLTNQIDPKGLGATLFISENMVRMDRLGVTYQGTMKNHELALQGNRTDEKLSRLSAPDQETKLTSARDKLYRCYVCGGEHVAIKGFLPSAFDQNEDTFGILEKMGIIYDAGFQAGVVYRPGYENATWPYAIEGHNLYAVPVSTTNIDNERVYLSDRYLKEEKRMSGSQWYDLLVKKFDESSENGDPMVVIFSNLISGDGDYLDAYKKFIDYALSRKAAFVTTLQLVDMAAAKKKGGKIGAIALTNNGTLSVEKLDVGVIPNCPTCDKTDGEAMTSIFNVTVEKGGKCLECIKNSANSTNSTST
jgi:peptidoglycan/xylan/chitin deacetylase (PgdA/CDA1 family)